MRAPTRLETVLYKAALYLYPPAFRREFSGEMLRDFQDARREPHVLAGRRQLWGFRRRMAADVATSIPLQWARSGWPAIVALSLAGPLLSAVAAGTLVRPAHFTIPSGTDQDDLLAMLVVVLLMLFIVVATIIFTFWFAHFRLRRRV